jgi:hypothetical protein
MNYLHWKASPNSVKNSCALTYLKNVKDAQDIDVGESRASGFPKDAYMPMNPDHPKDTVLIDQLYNLDGYTVVSAKIKEFLEEKDIPQLEFLPIAIQDLAGKTVSSDYWIVNPLAVIDCVDQENSEIDWNAIDPEIMSSCFGLTLLSDEIDEDLLLFRPKHMKSVVFIREDLAEEMDEAGFTGTWFVDLDEFEL